IRTQARLRFGWVMPRETGYRVIGDNGKILGNSATTLSQPVASSGSAGTQWWDAAWQSVETAGGEPTTTSRGPASGTDGRNPAGHIDKSGKTSSGVHRPQHQNNQNQKEQGGG